MEFATAITGESQIAAATADLRRQLSDLPRDSVHAVFVFASAHFEDELEALSAALAEAFPDAALLGCTAEGTIGAGRELERTPSISVLAASLPGVIIRPFHLSQSDLQKSRTLEDWTEQLGVRPDESPVFIVLGDPFSFPVDYLLQQLNQHYAGTPVFGGMASGAERQRQNGLLLNGVVYHEGLVGFALSGNLSVRSVVSQGCRPVGKPFVVTKGERNVIRELGGKPALQVLQEISNSLSPQDLKLAQEALFVGRVINEYQDTFKRGDFLIHHLMGGEPESGALAIAGPVKVGSTVQFHVRDARCADEDLRELLRTACPPDSPPPAGALLFSCNGRGTRMWPEPGHDVSVLMDLCSNVPAAGFFCAGELGPIGERNFIHGFTASIALFQPREAGP